MNIGFYWHYKPFNQRPSGSHIQWFGAFNFPHAVVVHLCALLWAVVHPLCTGFGRRSSRSHWFGVLCTSCPAPNSPRARER